MTLTTGDVSTFDTTGQIKVTGGSVNFGAGNADLSGVTYFDVIAGSIGTSASGGTISGNSNIRMLCRGQHLHLQCRSLNNSRSFIHFASAASGKGIDLSLLGGANAGQITLISTDQGAGVKAPSNMTTTGGIKLTANGQIVFGNATARGSISATRRHPGCQRYGWKWKSGLGSGQGSVNFVTTTSGDIQLLGGVAATSTLTLKAAGAVTVGSGVTVSSSDTIDINAQAGDLTNGGIIQARRSSSRLQPRCSTSSTAS